MTGDPGMGTLDAFSSLGLAVALAMDAFAVSLAAGAPLKRIGFRRYFRLSFHFGFFQFMMPVIGWHLGSGLHASVSSFDHWLAFSLLALVGSRMITGASGDRRPGKTIDPSRGLTLVALSVATSIDALAVGLSLAMISVSVWKPSILIGATAAAASVVGLRLGAHLGARFGRSAEIAGGIVLFAIGFKILANHLL